MADVKTMPDAERDAKFRADFARLKQNREAVPLERLQKGRLAKKYGELVQEVTDGGDWFARYFLNYMLKAFPFGFDEAGRAEARAKTRAIIAEENRPGGLRDRWRAALIEKLDEEAYNQAVFDRYDRIAREALYPYWRQHCRREGKAIYNDILHMYWFPANPQKGRYKGCWANPDYTGRIYDYPPLLLENWAVY